MSPRALNEESTNRRNIVFFTKAKSTDDAHSGCDTSPGTLALRHEYRHSQTQAFQGSRLRTLERFCFRTHTPRRNHSRDVREQRERKQRALKRNYMRVQTGAKRREETTHGEKEESAGRTEGGESDTTAQELARRGNFFQRMQIEA